MAGTRERVDKTPHRKLELSIFIGKDPIGGRSFALNITS